MKLFDAFEAIKFPEEDMIFITYSGYLYYIYNSKYKWWRKHHNAGNDHLTVSNYPDVSREELIKMDKYQKPSIFDDVLIYLNETNSFMHGNLSKMRGTI